MSLPFFKRQISVPVRSRPTLVNKVRKPMNLSDRDRKKTWKLQQRKLAQDAFPISDSLLEVMFEAVDAQVETLGCDHTLRFTEAWIAEHKQPAEEVLAWLSEHGGFCDCEAVANAADYWEQNR
jgi:hypothetical protein